MGCIAGAYAGAVCSCRDCRSNCPVKNRGCSIKNKCDDCENDAKQMDKILGITINLKAMKLDKAKQKALDAIREYRLLLENDKNEKLDEVLRELSIN
jgi:ribosomal protein S1